MNPYRTSLTLFTIILSIAFGVNSNAQDNTSSITIDYDNQSVPDAIRSLAAQSKAVIVFSDDFFDSTPYITKSYNNRTLSEILTDLLRASNLEYRQSGSAIVIYRKIQKMHHLHGYILDSESGERLPYALVSIEAMNESVISNEEGYYNFALPKGSYTIETSYIGHHTLQHAIAINENAIINLKMIS